MKNSSNLGIYLYSLYIVKEMRENQREDSSFVTLEREYKSRERKI